MPTNGSRPQAPDGTPDPARGIRQFVVGTGGKNHDNLCCHRANSEVTDNTTFGILKMTLTAAGYDECSACLVRDGHRDPAVVAP